MFRNVDSKTVSKVIENPTLVARELERLLKKPLHVPQRVWFSLEHETTNVMERDWDNILVLDACRYDTLATLDPFDTTVRRTVSKASQSGEFCEKYFSGRQFHDTVYVTANPYGAQVDSDVFHDTIPTFDNGTAADGERAIVDDLGENWAPDLVADTALDAHERYPNKRLVVHFMQPHAPYYGETARQLRNQLKDDGLCFWAWDEQVEKIDMQRDDTTVSHLLEAAQEGYITPDDLKTVYIENLAFVVDYARDLCDELGGKTAITSDHGEMLGERKRSLPTRKGHLKNYIGHERGVYTMELREVPWVTVERGQRRSVTEEPPVTQADIDETALDDQLQALGYKQ